MNTAFILSVNLAAVLMMMVSRLGHQPGPAECHPCGFAVGPWIRDNRLADLCDVRRVFYGRKFLIAGLVTIWGLRLCLHLTRRKLGPR